MEKTRIELKERFKKGGKPTEQDYADLIDSLLHRLDDDFVASLPDATTTQKGIVEQATIAEVETGTDSTRFVTPEGAKRAAETHAPVTSVNGQTGAITIEAPQAEDSGWQTASLNLGVTNDDTVFQATRYRKKSGVVYIEGHVKMSGVGSSVNLFSLPSGFRPSKKLVFASVMTNGTSARIEVRSGGGVTCTTPSDSGISLSGISFIVD